jgi:hypothetical protein
MSWENFSYVLKNFFSPRSPTIFGKKIKFEQGSSKKKIDTSKQFWKNNRTGWKWTPPPTSFPGSSLSLRKDPGWGWSRVTRKFDRPRGSRQSIKLHASTFALYTSIARSECFIQINFENHIYFKILAKFDLCLLLNYNNMLNRVL